MKNISKEYKKYINGNLVDVLNYNKINKDKFYQKTLNLWGKNNHKKNKKKHDGNNTHIEKVIEIFPLKENIENFLELGCGEGIDLRFLIKKKN